MAESSYECFRGWLVAPSPSDDGTIVPFFIKVREKDICWSIPENLNKIYSKFNGGTSYFTEPGMSLTMTVNDWNVKIDHTGQYTATKKVGIYRNFSLNNNDRTDIVYTLNLPFRTMKDESFSVQCTTCSNAEDIALATPNVILPSTSDIASIDLHLRNAVTKFLTNPATQSEYISSYVFIHVDGVVNLSTI